VRILSVVAEENVLKNVVAGSGNNDAISLDQFQFVGHQADLFVQFMRQLHLLNSDQQGNIRFIHLLLRDYFAYSRAIATLSDGDRVLRYLASTTLGHLGDRRAVNLLIAALVDVDAVVRSGIAVALG